MSSVIIYTDGGARHNPGPAGAGVVITKDGQVIAELKQFLGAQTNNWVEYEAVYLALQEALRLGFAQEHIEIRLDSKLVAEQLSGNWKVKEPTIKTQWLKVRELMRQFRTTPTFTHIPREQNKEADRLVNEAIDEAGF